MAGPADAALTRPAGAALGRRNREPLIWVIDAGLPGVTNQCLGVARAIATLAPCRIETVKMRLRSRMLQPLFRWALRRGLLDRGGKLPARLSAGLFFSASGTHAEQPDLVVSALGRSEFSAAYLRRSAGAISVHIGIPARLPSECFDFIIVVRAKDTTSLRPPHVRLKINPTPVLMAEMAETARPAGEAWRAGRKRLWAVLVGGDGAGYVYRPEDWSCLARSLAGLGHKVGAGYLVTTSRRTGAAAEAILRESMSVEGVVADAVWHAHGGPGKMTDYLAAAEAVFCTEDSRSMISDAVAAGKPVYAVRPEGSAPNPRDAELLAQHEATRRIRRVPITGVAELDVDRDIASWFQPLTECWSTELVAALLAGAPRVRRMFDGARRDA